MKVLQFTIPVARDRSVISEQFALLFFYPHLHRHKEIQLTWIQQGEGTLIAGNNMHNFRGDEIYLLGADLPHLFKSNPEYFNSNSNKSIKAVTIFFDPFGKIAPLFELPEMEAFRKFIQQNKQGFKLPKKYTGILSGIMLEVENSSGVEKMLNFFRILHFLNSIKDNLAQLSSYSHIPNFDEKDGLRISNIYNYVTNHYSESISLKDVSQVAYLTPQAFCRYFKKHTGHTYISFLNEIRINEACKRLTSNKFESISVIAYKCGFNTITNFNRVFKCVTGKSPKEYVDDYLNNVKVAF